jgi:hypothetical protein
VISALLLRDFGPMLKAKRTPGGHCGKNTAMLDNQIYGADMENYERSAKGATSGTPSSPWEP